MANLKTEVDKLDIDKLVPVPTDLSKLSNVIKNVVKKADYIKLVIIKIVIILYFIILVLK